MARQEGKLHSPRSFVRRAGRITPAQQRALEVLWPVYGVDPEFPGALGHALNVPGRHTLEIGFGDGAALLYAAATHSENHYLGLEVHEPGIGHVLNEVRRFEMDNVRLLRGDAVEVIERFPEESLDSVWLFFPDPWPKKRHHKRRLIQPSFMNSLSRRLKHRGRLLVATDWAPYAEHMLEVLDRVAMLRNLAGIGRYSPRPDVRPLTKFELRGLTLGHRIRDLAYEKV